MYLISCAENRIVLADRSWNVAAILALGVGLQCLGILVLSPSSRFIRQTQMA